MQKRSYEAGIIHQTEMHHQNDNSFSILVSCYGLHRGYICVKKGEKLPVSATISTKMISKQSNICLSA